MDEISDELESYPDYIISLKVPAIAKKVSASKHTPSL